MIRMKAVVLGAVAFIAVHLVLVATWPSLFHGGGGHRAWFMNSGAAVAFTAVVFALAGLLAVIAGRDGRTDSAFLAVLNIALGAAFAMIVTMVLLPGGPGNLFPIAFVIGVAILFVAGAAGACVGLLGIRIGRTGTSGSR